MKPALTPKRALLTSGLILLTTSGLTFAEAADTRITSPDGKLAVTVTLTETGAPRYRIERDGKPVLRESKLGLIRDDADFSQGLKLLSATPQHPVEDAYDLPGSKRLHNTYKANRRLIHLEAKGGKKVSLAFQVSNDGAAFRYRFPETDATVRKLKEELSSFHFPADSKAWLQPIAVAKSGWSSANPSYEEYYEKDIPVGVASPTGAGWVYPALFRTGDTWVLISETGLGRNYCATRLRSASPDGEYSVGFADPREVGFGGPAHPESTLPWVTPWRVIAIGSLKTIVESTLGTDLADAPDKPAKIEPGKASWSWPLLKDDMTTFDVQKRFIDYAAEMGWRYCLVDALWDKQIGYDKLKELCDYAKTKNVKILVWYNSAGDWNTAPQTPRDMLLTRESRLKEFARIKELGVAGLKIDFFGGDGQSMISYYHDLLQDAEPFGFLMNFHGCTLPRGWQRTYPHLVTMESIRGLEYMTFEQVNADQGPTHIAMLPFTRNVFDPMDFTPVVLDTMPGIKRHTTSACELATAVLFTSGIQHYAEIPEGLAKAPDYVKAMLKEIPSVWEDTKFIDGVPGKFVVMARKSRRKMVSRRHAVRRRTQDPQPRSQGTRRSEERPPDQRWRWRKPLVQTGKHHAGRGRKDHHHAQAEGRLRGRVLRFHISTAPIAGARSRGTGLPKKSRPPFFSITRPRGNFVPGSGRSALRESKPGAGFTTPANMGAAAVMTPAGNPSWRPAKRLLSNTLPRLGPN